MGIRAATRFCMRSFLAAVTISGFLMGPVAGASPKKKFRTVKLPRHDRRAETREIESLEELWRTAIVKGDTSVMEKLLSDDFLSVSARGTLSDKQQYLARIASHATQLSAFNLIDMKIRVQPGSAVAVSQAHITGMLEGRPIEGTFRYTKVYARGPNGQWQMTNFEATRVSAPDSAESDMSHGVTNGENPNR